MTKSSLMTREQAELALADHVGVLNKCFELAWKRWCEWLHDLPGSPADVTANARAQTLHGFIVAEVRRSMSGREGVQVFHKNGLWLVRIQDRLVIRFKKFRNGAYKTSSNVNQQSIAFDSQQLSLEAGLLTQMTHLVMGYLLDEVETSMKTVAVTCVVDGKHYWAPIELSTTTGDQGATILGGPAKVDPTAAKPRVRSKGRKRKLEE
ncbi:hypothetical protein [Actinokineospora bangkokensis]|uniref:Uncharacterized protein n=1 Tax=Actinokineospora bangkokensis TaxID=1193682 RepID=A0A1Q9LC00_9PSEU|nr:hypothetical protein [Actinokineospora bangkokensis]OLR89536.1 hypothetical protein BJP25_05520 [Actinokineospora bangkokensis]